MVKRAGWRVVAMVAACVVTGALMSAAASAATIPLTGRVAFDVDNYLVDGSAHCSGRYILLIDVPSDVVSYTASVVQTSPYFGSTIM